MEIKKLILPEIKLEHSAYHFVDLEANEEINDKQPIEESEIKQIEEKSDSDKIDYEELENIKLQQYKQGYNEGYKKAQEDLNNSNQSQLSAMISNINIMLASLSSEIDQKINEMIPELVDLSKIIGEKIAGCEINLNYKMQIKSSIEEVISLLSKNISVTIMVNPINVQFIKSVISEYFNESQDNKIIILEDNKISLYDCKLEWSNGIFLYSLKDRIAEVEHIIRENLSKEMFVNSNFG